MGSAGSAFVLASRAHGPVGVARARVAIRPARGRSAMDATVGDHRLERGPSPEDVAAPRVCVIERLEVVLVSRFAVRRRAAVVG